MPVITLSEKGKKDYEFIPLKPLRDLRQITGTYDEIKRMAKSDPNNKEDFIDVILTNENDVLDAISTLREDYPNIIKLTYDNKATRAAQTVENIGSVNELNPLEMFETFYESRRGTKMDSQEKEYIQSLIEKIWGEE